jgi:hypothetical protein
MMYCVVVFLFFLVVVFPSRRDMYSLDRTLVKCVSVATVCADYIYLLYIRWILKYNSNKLYILKWYSRSQGSQMEWGPLNQ